MGLCKAMVFKCLEGLIPECYPVQGRIATILIVFFIFVEKPECYPVQGRIATKENFHVKKIE